MTIEDLKQQELIIYECISGSKAYGLDTPASDTDIRGVFILPKEKFYGMEYIPQVSDATNDTVYYELGRFIELLNKNNPNILELLATPEKFILKKHPLMDAIKREIFLSKKCKDSFGGYAFTQVRKARGLNKKIANPMDKTKKVILDFCHVLKGQGSVPLRQWLAANNYQQEHIGLVNIPYFKDTHGLYYDASGTLGYKGVMKKKSATTVVLSSIPKGEQPLTHLHFNQDGFIKYCKDYREYWDWVEKRNQSRYQNNIEHGKNYDSKNMMHTFRLLDMAFEILDQGRVIVQRPNREELLSIRSGKWDYNDLMVKAIEKMEAVEKIYLTSKLQDSPDPKIVENLLVDIRTQFYETQINPPINN